MPKTKVLIAAKTYPTLSKKYDELVCTAGFREDGRWVRIYPVPFRKLDYGQRYKKWQWIELNLVKNTSDPRLESYRPYDIEEDILIGESIGTEQDWSQRKSFVLSNVKNNMTSLINEAQGEEGTSLAVFKPSEIIDFVWEESSREWNKERLDAIAANQAQGDLFEGAKDIFTVVNKIPYDFSYVFTSEDGKQRKLMIIDWELGQLYWGCLKAANGDEDEACRKVKEKFFNWMIKERDLYFFLGTTKRFHSWATNPFVIIGIFYPPKEKHDPQLKIDFEF